MPISPIKITAVEVLLLDVPTIRPHLLSVATMRQQTLVLVFIRSDDGILGYGEATTIGGLAYGEESPESIKTNIDTYMAPLLIGGDATNIAARMQSLRKPVQGNRFAKCAIETALFDAHAKRLGVPLSTLFGGRIVDSLPVAWTLASGNTERDIAEAETMLDLKRHRIFKLKIGLREVREDVAHVAAIKRVIGERGSVRVDVNQAWTETEAMLGMHMLHDAGIDLVEQPIAAGNHEGLRRLRNQNRIPLMADESLHGPSDAYQLAKHHAVDVFAIKITQSGGLTGARDVASIAEAAHVELYGGTMLEGAIGTIASAQLFSTFPALAWGTELFGPLLLTEEILRTPLTYKDFSLQLPTGPGLGIELDEDRIHFLRRDKASIKEKNKDKNALFATR
ncbi:muconate/chloromuconate family cycloisomerase [Herbaspirillum sp. RTI4]|uniref:muconate/chloromuconate family cycloisomerase n=1 Tax=Herbaspirillum sp. RTI4 TaxID=3048640 RepID=UPI002AB57D03|nr:muconate/chloromuconate family cycloisomerase [Herbaspirillum sp. RTI4]MDY7577193.1 muconate/chloromuconate family cycloisomerase [Herbaspirillum sp. RTI4]MEA9980483.1 muconate/chloromuconate family cycloisomerase [Herbaspirillum sp. RTI4]